MGAQLTIDGDEVPLLRPDAARPGAPLRGAQREILLWIRDHGSIRTVEAGVIVHAHRPAPCTRGRGDRLGCCGWAASDGWQALKRLEARGLIRAADARGRWVTALGAAPAQPDVVAALDGARARLRAERAPLEDGVS